MTLFAVHISDGVLTWPWLAGGFGLTACLLVVAMWRVRDDEVSRIGLLTAAFFITTQIHIKLPGASIHMLLSGLVGIVLGRRAPLAIFVGLLLQCMLTGHGGYFSLGVNTCVMTVPALLSWLLFGVAHRVTWNLGLIGRSATVAVSTFVLFYSAAYSFALVSSTSLTQQSALDLANALLCEPWLVGACAYFTVAAIFLERRLENAPEFPLGFLIGETSVLLTAALNCIVLILGGETHWHILPLVIVIVHIPFAVVEGVISGFVIGFLTNVKPEMLGLSRYDPNVQCIPARSPDASG